MADEDLATLNVDSAVVGQLLELAADHLIQHAGRIGFKHSLQLGDGVGLCQGTRNWIS